MPLYEVMHSIPLNEAEKSEVARAITAIHTRRFAVPSLFVNVRFTDAREHHMYVGGEKVSNDGLLGLSLSRGTKIRLKLGPQIAQYKSNHCSGSCRRG